MQDKPRLTHQVSSVRAEVAIRSMRDHYHEPEITEIKDRVKARGLLPEDLERLRVAYTENIHRVRKLKRQEQDLSK